MTVEEVLFDNLPKLETQPFVPSDKVEQLILDLLLQHRRKKDEYGEDASVASMIVGINNTHYQLARITEKLIRANRLLLSKNIDDNYDSFESMMLDIAGHALLGLAQYDQE